MKKTVLFILILLFVLNITSPAIAVEKYHGQMNYPYLNSNIAFKDIDSHWANKSIYKMAALSLVRGMGNEKFEPDESLSHAEALALAVRLKGLEAVAQAEAENLSPFIDTGNLVTPIPKRDWARGYIKVALDNNLITPQEKALIMTLSPKMQDEMQKKIDKKMEDYQNKDDYQKKFTSQQLANILLITNNCLRYQYTWNHSADREEAVIWIIRALGVSPVRGSQQQAIYNLQDWQQIKTENIPLIEAALQAGIISGTPHDSFKPHDHISRAEIASILDRAFNLSAARMGYKVINAYVEDITAITTTRKIPYSEQFDIIEKNIYNVKNYDGSYVDIISEQSNSTSYRMSFPVYNNGRLSEAESMCKNKHIQYITNSNNEMLWVEILH